MLVLVVMSPLPDYYLTVGRRLGLGTTFGAPLFTVPVHLATLAWPSCCCSGALFLMLSQGGNGLLSIMHVLVGTRI